MCNPVARELIELAIRSASTAPSGAHKQPWQFVAVSDATLKAQMREAAEREERENYASRMSAEWLQALAPLGTDEHKAHITDAPWVVVAFKKPYDFAPRRRTTTSMRASGPRAACSSRRFIIWASSR